MSNFTVSSSPHVTQKNNSTRIIMADVLIALAPVVVASVYFFSYHVLINIVACAIGCMGFEMLYGMFVKKAWNKEGVKNSSVWDLSCFVTAVLLAHERLFCFWQNSVQLRYYSRLSFRQSGRHSAGETAFRRHRKKLR